MIIWLLVGVLIGTLAIPIVVYTHAEWLPSKPLPKDVAAELDTMQAAARIRHMVRSAEMHMDHVVRQHRNRTDGGSTAGTYNDVKRRPW